MAWNKNIRELKPGEMITLQGERFVLQAYWENDVEPTDFFLTSMDMKTGQTFDNGYPDIHIREKDFGIALFKKDDLIRIVESKDYYIG